MGFRFRKSFKAGPFRTTISKSGISTSFGVKGARITKKANGNTMTTLNIPGTGLSYVSEKSNKKQSEISKDTESNTVINDTPKKIEFLKIIKYSLFSLAIFIISLILAVIIDTPIIMIGGLITSIFFIIIKCKK